ncbi:MAG: FeoB small GTPase domain-containing protein [Armatimonadota bacterium]|nr:50S ribosome-binding GTPase [bacterium]MDW8319849.1 FeoB small GTPase domain-containing protein [Armatimonadota bacterium]
MSRTHSDDSSNVTARVVLVGSPNVGKSVLFNRLTGRYVVVSNYPGTTVEVARGQARIGETVCEVIDTPGMYSLSPITEEERVARALLLREQPDVVIHVVDAKNLNRMLSLTLQLLEAGLPVVLLLNMMDEADRLHLYIDHRALAKRLGIPVIPASLISGRGVEELKNIVSEYLSARQNRDLSSAD